MQTWYSTAGCCEKKEENGSSILQALTVDTGTKIAARAPSTLWPYDGGGLPSLPQPQVDIHLPLVAYQGLSADFPSANSRTSCIWAWLLVCSSLQPVIFSLFLTPEQITGKCRMHTTGTFILYPFTGMADVLTCVLLLGGRLGKMVLLRLTLIISCLPPGMHVSCSPALIRLILHFKIKHRQLCSRLLRDNIWNGSGETISTMTSYQL